MVGTVIGVLGLNVQSPVEEELKREFAPVQILVLVKLEKTALTLGKVKNS